MLRQPTQQKAAIYDYDGSSCDEYGELLFGFYWQLLNNQDVPITGLMGPYPCYDTCYAACDRAFQRHDY